MPLKFWKKEKPKTGKEKEAPEAKAPPKPSPGAKKPEAAKPEGAKAEAAKPEAKPAPEAAAPAKVAAVVDEVHARLVGLGLTVPPTKPVFTKRVASFPGGEAAFVKEYESEPYRAVTRVLSDWVGFHVPESFDPDQLLSEVNLRLSSFNLAVESKDLSWLDQDLNLRKAKLVLGDQEKVVRFKDARDFMKGVNELIDPRKLAFLELETWDDRFAFLLVREPRWEKLAETELVVVKADQTAHGGECGECGAAVGKYWSDCLKCGAVFG
jgi:hypothetical protein